MGRAEDVMLGRLRHEHVTFEQREAARRGALVPELQHLLPLAVANLEQLGYPGRPHIIWVEDEERVAWQAATPGGGSGITVHLLADDTLLMENGGTIREVGGIKAYHGHFEVLTYPYPTLTADGLSNILEWLRYYASPDLAGTEPPRRYSDR